MKIQDITNLLEKTAPLYLQESYDNAGMITGQGSWECNGIIICLDATEAVVNEAIERKCNLIISHHPIVFSGLKKITGNNYVERAVILAIKNDIALYAIHTNLDNVAAGVNKKIADKIGLINTRILQPKESMLKKLVCFVPKNAADKLRNAFFEAGAGAIGKYSECSFNTEGTGTFKPLEGSNPAIGEQGKRHEEPEMKVEVIFPAYMEQKLLETMVENHPYEEVAYDIIALGNYLSDTGGGMIGDLPAEIDERDLLQRLKNDFKLSSLRHTALINRPLKKIAICGGAGIFLLKAALRAGADAYITADIKYHEFFDADGRLLLADIGHYESEQFTTELIYDILKEKFPNFALLKTSVNTNPVHYL
jgi:dinuclear metal center YbgI/SA1388 family protein